MADVYLFTILNWSAGLRSISRVSALVAYQARVRAIPSVERAMLEEGMIKPEAAKGHGVNRGACADKST